MFENDERAWAIMPAPLDGETAKQAQVYEVTVTMKRDEPDTYAVQFVHIADGQAYMSRFGGNPGYPPTMPVIARKWHMGRDKVELVTRCAQTIQSMADSFAAGAGHLRTLVARELAEAKAAEQGKVLIEKGR